MKTTGFTLVEVLISIAILGIALVSVTQLQVSNMITNSRAVQLNELDKAALSEIELVKKTTLTAGLNRACFSTMPANTTCQYSIFECELKTTSAALNCKTPVAATVNAYRVVIEIAKNQSTLKLVRIISKQAL